MFKITSFLFSIVTLRLFSVPVANLSVTLFGYDADDKINRRLKFDDECKY